MVNKLGLFTDLHGDKRSLDSIVKALETLGVSSSVFLGDFIYETMTEFTHSAYAKSDKILEQLLQKSDLREDFLAGKFTEEQLEQYTKPHKSAVSTSKKVAKAEFEHLKQALAGQEYAILGGNWDYTEEIQEVFGDDYLNGDSKTVGGLNVMGFSGGGSPSNLTATRETLADQPPNGGSHYMTWAQAMMKKDLDADILVSHLPFTDGENKIMENSVERLKDLVKKRKDQLKQAGKESDVPKVFMWGHRHSSGQVEYDEELEGFIVAPGCASHYHNSGMPTFMVADFDDDNKIVSATRFGIAHSGEVREAGIYTFDYDAKKVDFKDTDKVILEGTTLEGFEDNLKLDDNFKLIQEGLNIDYDSVRDSPKDLDFLLRKNIHIMQHDMKEISEDVKRVLANQALRLIGENAESRECVITDTLDGLAELAFEKVGIDSAEVKTRDTYVHIRHSVMTTILGIDSGKLMNILRDETPENHEETYKWGLEIIEESQNVLSKSYQNHIFQDLEAEDYQAMAETYMPTCYERTEDLEEGKAFQFWLNSYRSGIIDSETVEETKAYKTKDGFEYKTKTKDELREFIEDKLPYFANEEEDSLEDRLGTQPERREITEEEALEVGKKIRDEEYPVFEIRGNQFAEDPKTKTRYMIQDPSNWGLEQGEYEVLGEQEFMTRQREDLMKPTQPDIGQTDSYEPLI